MRARLLESLLALFTLALSGCATVSMRGDAQLTDNRTDHLSGLVGPVDDSVWYGVKLPKLPVGYLHTQIFRVRRMPADARIEYYIASNRPEVSGPAERAHFKEVILEVTATNIQQRPLHSERISLGAVNWQTSLQKLSRALFAYTDYDLTFTVEHAAPRAGDYIEICGTGPTPSWRVLNRRSSKPAAAP